MDCCGRLLGAEVDRPAGTVTLRRPDRPDRRARARRGRATSSGPSAPRARRRGRAWPRCATLVGDRQADRPGRPHRAVARTSSAGLLAYRELLRAPAGVARPGRAPRLRLPVPARPARIPRVHRRGAAAGREIEDEFGTDGLGPAAPRRRTTTTRARWPRYRLADVLLVNPIRDGMNLVAKEGAVLSERGLRAGAVPGGRRRRRAGRGRADGQPVRRDRDRRRAARRRCRCRPASGRRGGKRLLAAATALPPADWFRQQLDALDR